MIQRASAELMNKINQVVKTNFSKVNDFIISQLASRVDLVEEIGSYIVEAGGKRIRPLLVLLVSGGCGYSGNDHIPLAVTIEFLHTASLLHDDVVDMSDMRRGRPTVNASWGNPSSVLVGDFLYSRAFQIMVEMGRLPVMQVLADATNCIAEGEVQQLAHLKNTHLDEATYFEIIYRKTARLFEAAAHTAALLSDADAHNIEAMRLFGKHLGMVFQLADDWLDYTGEHSQMGKHPGDDLAEGKLTLPLIHALRFYQGCGEADFIRDAIISGNSEHLATIVDLMKRADSIGYTKTKAEKHADAAIKCIDHMQGTYFKDDMCRLVWRAFKRQS